LRSSALPRVLLALAAALPLTGGSASAATARFRASIEGAQTIRWTVEPQDGPSACGGTYSGSGRETIRFRSIRPQRVTVRMAGRGVPAWVIARRWARLDTRGRVNRAGTLTLNPNGRPCGDGGGGEPAPPPAPDCGIRRFTLLPLMPVPINRNRITIDVGDPAPLSPFRNCPVYGPGFPELLAPVPARLPARELFDRSIGKEIVLGRGHRHETAAGITVDTRLRWSLTLERIR
jgi:hypothetical protein